MRKVLIPIFLLPFFFSACYEGIYSIKQTGNCYSNSETGLTSKLKLNGYYTQTEIIRRNIGYPPNVKTVEDTIITNMVFYKDGIFLAHFEKEIFKSRKDRIKKFKFYSGYRDSYWGRYTLHNDTIQVLVLPPPGTQGVGVGYYWYKIINQSTIREICYKSGEPITPEDIIKYQEHPPEWFITLSDGNFVYYDNLPDPNLSWLKKQKWFWCNESEYKQWKKQQKVKTKSK